MWLAIDTRSPPGLTKGCHTCIFFVRTGRLLLTSDTNDISCLVHSNFCMKTIVFGLQIFFPVEI